MCLYRALLTYLRCICRVLFRYLDGGFWPMLLVVFVSGNMCFVYLCGSLLTYLCFICRALFTYLGHIFWPTLLAVCESGSMCSRGLFYIYLGLVCKALLTHPGLFRWALLTHPAFFCRALFTKYVLTWVVLHMSGSRV